MYAELNKWLQETEAEITQLRISATTYKALENMDDLRLIQGKIAGLESSVDRVSEIIKNDDK